MLAARVQRSDAVRTRSNAHAPIGVVGSGPLWRLTPPM